MVSDEMTLEEKIVAWGNQRSDWQRYLLKRIADGKTFTETDYDELVEDILAQRIPNTNLDLQSVPFTSTGSQTVRLVSIEESHHTNALDTPVPLTFDPFGITIIYGDNGAGKSGYARLLKCITRARHQEDVLSDVFRDSSHTKPSASFIIKIEDIEESFTWPDSDMTEPRQMLFYDAACCDEYISTESDFPYRPPAFLIMDRLIEACTAVRDRIDSKLSENMPSLEILPKVDDDVRHTEIGKFLTELSKDSTISTLDELIAGLVEMTESLQDLKTQEARLATSNTDSEKQRLIRSAERFDSLSNHFKNLQTVLGDDALVRIERQRYEVKSLEDAVSRLAESMESEPLNGVGTPSWKELWKSAKHFSETEAYPKSVFPIVDVQSRCVLCQQELDIDSRERLSRLSEFSNDTVQVQLSEVSSQYNNHNESIVNLTILPEAERVRLSDLEQIYPELIDLTRNLVTRLEGRRQTIIDLLAGSAYRVDLVTEVNSEDIIEELVGHFNDKASKLRGEADELSDYSIQAKLKEVTRRRKEIELLEEAMDSKDAICKEIARLEICAKLHSIKDSATTGPISRNISELSEDSITEYIRDLFTREADRLNLERVTVAKTRANKGVLLHKPKLVRSSQNAPLPQVFSEGEKSALGLAAFFTETRLDTSKSSIILDDPVSSLDHRRRALVARRLVELAEDRQVIIFTHDASFISDLKLEAKSTTVEIADRSVERELAGERKPGKCTMQHPWHVKDVSERLNQLENTLIRIQNEISHLDQKEYDEQVSIWAGDLSETWERIIRQYVVGPILADGGLEVRPKMVKILAKFSDADEREFQASYSRISKWIRRHDKSGQVNYTPPDVGELRTELDRVKEWLGRIKRCQD